MAVNFQSKTVIAIILADGKPRTGETAVERVMVASSVDMFVAFSSDSKASNMKLMRACVVGRSLQIRKSAIESLVHLNGWHSPSER